MIIIFLSLFVLLIGSCALVLRSPQFGKVPTNEQKQGYVNSSQHNGENFKNEIPTSMKMGFFKSLSVAWKFFRGVPRGKPSQLIPVEKTDTTSLAIKGNNITWFGHSAVLLQSDGKNILLDPMLGLVPAPFNFLGSPRFNPTLPMTIEQLPVIDAVVFSHDHYDHLDYESVLALKDKVKHWYVPLGVDNHLIKWGVEKSKITTLDWWESSTLSGSDVVFTCTPARHFSGRGLTDRNATLWSSWVIKIGGKKIFFSGDGGYWNGFKQIGEKYGPFDFAMVECGQYNENWENIHMFPEQSVQALIDLKAAVGLPIHWGAFRLSLHAWDDSPIRFIKAAQANNVKYITPLIGERVDLDNLPAPIHWWEEYTSLSKDLKK